MQEWLKTKGTSTSPFSFMESVMAERMLGRVMLNMGRVKNAGCTTNELVMGWEKV